MREMRNCNVQHSPVNRKSTIVKSDHTNCSRFKSTVILVPPDSKPVLRDKSRLARSGPGASLSLGDLQDLIRGKLRDTANKKQLTRKSDGKEYKVVRREYIF